MANPENPYLPDRGQQLATLLMSLGQGFTAADAAGRSPWAGLSYGAGMYGQAQHQANQEAQKAWQWQQTYNQQDAYRQAQEEALKAQTQQRQQELDITNKLMPGMADLLKPGGGSPQGFGVPQAQPTMGPGGDYLGTLAQGESGGKYDARNPSGAYGKYQFMPATWSTVAQNNPDLKLPFNMAQSTPQQQEGAVRALTASNAQGLKAAGIEPTPDNLYLAHRFGVDGTKTMLSAKPETPVASIFPAQWVQQNPDLQGSTVGQFRQLAQQRFASGNPQIAPQQPAGTVQPPRVDPMKFLPYTLSKTLAPFGQAGIAIGNSETDRFMKDQDRLQRDEQFNRTQGGVERNATVGPDNRPNQAKIDAETAAAKAKAEAESGVKLENDAALKLSADEMARYSKEIRPQVEGAANSMPNLYEMKRLADGPIASGPFMDTRMLGARVADWLGLSGISDPMVNRTEFNNRAAKNVLAILQTKALGSGSGISSTDREFVEKMAGSGGTFAQPELKRIIDIGIKAQQLTLDQHGPTVDRLAKLPGVGKIDKGYFNITAPSYDEWAKANPPVAAAPAAASSLEDEMKRRGLLGRSAPAPSSNPLNDEMRRRGLR